MKTTTANGNGYESNCFLSQQRDLQLQQLQPRMQVEAAEGGCRITVVADKFVRGLAMWIDDDGAWFDNKL